MPISLAAFHMREIRREIRRAREARKKPWSRPRVAFFRRKSPPLYPIRFKRESLPVSARRRLNNINEVVCAVSEVSNISVASLRERDRKRKFAWPRHIAMLLARERSGHSYPEIGRYFLGRDHTSIISNVRKAEELIRHEPAVAMLYKEARQKLIGQTIKRLDDDDPDIYNR